MSENFRWDELEDEAIVVSEAKETAVYVNAKRDVVIRQRDWEDDDPFLVIPFHRIPNLISRLQALLKEGIKGV